jgi:hypothetical protein
MHVLLTVLSVLYTLSVLYMLSVYMLFSTHAGNNIVLTLLPAPAPAHMAR